MCVPSGKISISIMAKPVVGLLIIIINMIGKMLDPRTEIEIHAH